MLYKLPTAVSILETNARRWGAYMTLSFLAEDELAD